MGKHNDREQLILGGVPRFIVMTAIFVSLVVAYQNCGRFKASGTSPSSAPDSARNDRSAPTTAAYEKQNSILLMERRPAAGTSNGTFSIHSSRPDGTNSIQIASDGMSPSWTPDGRVIFVSNSSGSQQIWIADADGRNARQVGDLSPETMPLMPQIGRNGLIVFMGSYEDSEFDGNQGIWVMNEDGSGLKRLTIGMQPFLAASGTWLVFTLQTNEPYHRQIWRINTDGTGLQQLTSLGDPDYPDANAPSISPDESTVAFFSGKESARLVPGEMPTESIFDWGYRNVAIIPATGGTRKTLTPCTPVRSNAELEASTSSSGKCLAADNPTWSPNGKWLVFDTGFYTGTETWMVDIEGNQFQRFSTQSRGTVRVALKRR
ncbi:MAG: TolB family protein [Bdellovibrionales bacterium]